MGNIELTGNKDSAFLKMKPSQKTGDAKWKDVEDLINRWARRNPQGAIDNERWVKESHLDLKDQKFGASNNMGGGRLGVSIHPELAQYLEAFYPDLFSTKDGLHEFMRRFKKFTVPEKV
jgi:hypothetical protein